MKRTFKVDFGKLIGGHYDAEKKMFILDWMLKTGKPYRKAVSRWHVTGISQTLFAYSANEHDCKSPLPEPSEWGNYFDAIFARAVYMPTYSIIQDWRSNEKIHPEKYRMLTMYETYPQEYVSRHKNLPLLIWHLLGLKGKDLKKEFHQPDIKERLKPKIMGICTYTIGNGWVVEYSFNFECFKYEDAGWKKYYHQEEEESLWQFYGRVIEDIESKCLDQNLL